MEATLSIIATIISSMALFGVVASLLLQNRQLRASQIQVVRDLHLELIKLAIENPDLAASIYGDPSAGSLPVNALMNLQIAVWQAAYTLHNITEQSIRLQVAQMFRGKHVRDWWEVARQSYEVGMTTKKDREFFTIIDREFRNSLQASESRSFLDSAVPTQEAGLEERS